MRKKVDVALVAFFFSVLVSDARGDIDLWPLLEISDQSTTILYPLYVHEGPFVMMFPWYYRTNEGRDHHLLWPLLKLHEGSLDRLVPFWFRGEQDFLLFPLLHVSPRHTFWLLPPLFFQKRAAGARRLFIAPSFYREIDEREGMRRELLWPLYARAGDVDRRVVRLGSLGGAGWEGGLTWIRLFQYAKAGPSGQIDFALLARAKWGSDRSEACLIPLFFHFHEGQSYSTILAPVFRRWYDPDRRRGIMLALLFQWNQGVENPADGALSIWPFFHRDQTGDTRTRWILPYYRRWSPAGQETGIFPFYWSSRTPEGSSRDVFPLFGTSERTAPATGERSESMWLAAGAYARSIVFSSEGRLRKRTRRFLLFSDELDETGLRTFRIFGLPIVERMK